jgi:hypothetical protein
MPLRPSDSDYPEYYRTYVNLIEHDDVLEVLAEQVDTVMSMFADMDEARTLYRYADGKWSIREVLGHLLDSERIFGMRALCFARGEQQPLPGFDENVYVANALFDERPLDSILDEWQALRIANLILFQSFDDDAWSRSGTANNKPVTTNALAWIIAGHTVHHLNILRDRYHV